MYTIHANGELLFSSLSEEVESIALSPKLSLDINKAGSVSFVLPPGNGLHGKLKKLKSIVTVEQDGEQLSRGRVMETESDYYNQQSVYCEGDRAFLLDSVHAPYHYSGTVHGLFRQLVNNHNSMVDAEKQFVVGVITAVGESETTEVETDAWNSTSREMDERLLGVYGGYLRTRTVDGTHYLDWVAQYGSENDQPIEFEVNLLDLTGKVDAGDVFTVLIPLGSSEIGEDGEYTDPVSIASVNGGLNYIQDDAAVALYGKIWRTYTWIYEDDPSKLLEKAREYLKTGVALETLTLKAIDMHFVDGNVQPIRIGDKVRIRSNPHGLDKVMVCSRIEIDLLNPENTLYTFGERPRTLTENVVKAEEEVDSLTGYGSGGGGRKSVLEEVSDIIRWAQVNIDESNAYIQLTAGELDKTKEELKAAEIAISGAEAKITLHAGSIDKLTGEMTQAQIGIYGLNSEISLKADKIDLEGYVTIDSMNAEIAEINKFFTGSAQAQMLDANTLTCQTAQITNVSLINYDCNWSTVSMGDVASATLLGTKTSGSSLDLQHSHAVTVNDDGTITLGEVSSSGGSFKIADTKAYKDGVSAAKASVTLSESGWSGTSNVVNASNGEKETVNLPTLTLSQGSWSSNAKYVHLKMTDDSGAEISLDSIKVDASDVYDDGYDDGDSAGYNRGYSAVTLSQGSWNTSTYKKRVTASNSKYVTVDATEIYNKGYNYGYSVGYNEGRYS